MEVDLEALKKDIKKLVAEIAEVPEEDLKDDSRFVEDLGIDSMKALEIVASIEKKFKIVIPEDEIPTITSLNNVYELIKKLLNK